MKKKILSIAAGFICTILTSATFAQSATAQATSSMFTEKALSSFDKQFGNTVIPAIHSTAKGSLILQGEKDSRMITSVFNKKGKWIYSIVRYPSVNLDKYVMEAVQHNYDVIGYHITGMEKIDQPGMETVFIVHLKNITSYKTIKVSQNDVEAMQADQNV